MENKIYTCVRNLHYSKNVQNFTRIQVVYLILNLYHKKSVRYQVWYELKINIYPEYDDIYSKLNLEMYFSDLLFSRCPPLQTG